MKKHKRDLAHRYYLKGYQASIQRRSLTTCPHSVDSNAAYHWCRGWREGREDFWAGFNQQAFQQKVINL
ncbi:MAG TPA: ribosome modulation factor [Porticoccaceae bacterium]|nr:ribosome modulation factor [Porticoccaceae bacterium]|tara:strand:- start:61 stop:267 length:207 start_codon:yes stop_codon:yes gene_type:complete